MMSRGERVDDLKQLLGELRQAGKKPGRGLLDRVKACGPAAVRPLIEMATDAELLDSESDRDIFLPALTFRNAVIYCESEVRDGNIGYRARADGDIREA